MEKYGDLITNGLHLLSFLLVTSEIVRAIAAGFIAANFGLTSNCLPARALKRAQPERWLLHPSRSARCRHDRNCQLHRTQQPAQPYPRPASQPRPAEPQRTPALLLHGHRAGDRIASPQGAHAFRGSRIVNSLYSPTWLSTVMLPPCSIVVLVDRAFLPALEPAPAQPVKITVQRY